MTSLEKMQSLTDHNLFCSHTVNLTATLYICAELLAEALGIVGDRPLCEAAKDDPHAEYRVWCHRFPGPCVELVGNDKVCKAGHAYQGLQVSSY